MRQHWGIFDWAGNRIFPARSFESFDDAWSFILGEMTDMLGLVEEDFQEYEVRRVD